MIVLYRHAGSVVASLIILAVAVFLVADQSYLTAVSRTPAGLTHRVSLT